ncbi:MAG TPA: alpha/beta hydrolase [Methylibium sp.]|uniref:lipase family alpha/beta hydrolase n=1 Tax=Methylibium sp. TaxID=2067992 RepID=UPI002DB7373E|nr:alpha/beta hydrolase [Methylibium sp.]HEU4460426.1 alpha/beta hydrolase [Methylibium sp.]
MKRKPAATRASDARGAVRLGAEGVIAVADLAEALHRRIVRPLSPRPTRNEVQRTHGITGLVYRSVRGITRVVGDGADRLLAAMAERWPAQPAGRSSEREALVAALNGVLGDHLHASANPLAVTMALRSAGRALRLQPASLAAVLRHPGDRLAVFVHGLCMNDLQWRHEGHDHGAALARDLGVTPVYLHYNSGRAIADNGLAFALKMQALVAAWPLPLRELSIVGHSMGGLVARSAIEQARRAGQPWASRLDRLVFLGTPHHGAPLERGGHWIDLLLETNAYSAPFARLARLRSAGITDLRHGTLLPPPAGEPARDRFADAPEREPLPLPAGVACHALAGTLRGDLRSRLLGDGLVPLDSALGRHDDPRQALAFDADRQWIGAELGHLQMLGDPRAYRRLRQWFAAPLRRG